jgi:hypothetical protein
MQAPLVEPDTEPSSVLEPTGKQQDWWRKRRWLVPIAAIVLCSLATTLWLIRHKKAPAPQSLLSSSATDTHGVLRLKGTTQAVRTRSIQAPLLAGEKEGTLTITDLRAAGSSVKQGDILVEFDRQAQLRDSLDKQAQNSKLADDVLQEEAKEGAARAKDETEIKVAEGDLAKAELEMQKVGSPMQAADRRPNLPGGGTATTTYDENDRPTEVQIRDAKGEEVSRTVSVYDEQGHITEEKQILDDPLNLIPVDARARILADSGASGADLREQLKKLMGGHEGTTSEAYSYDAQDRVKETRRRFFNQDETIETTYNEQGDAAVEITRTLPGSNEPEQSLPAQNSEAHFTYQILRINMMTTGIGPRKSLPTPPAPALPLKPPVTSAEPSPTSEICTAFKNLRDTAVQPTAGSEPPASEQETCW